jgi:pyruvate/2-oxoglutarate dehydrogenase complex dihydrolipoamide dehydrogenase (E3) component
VLILDQASKAGFSDPHSFLNLAIVLLRESRTKLLALGNRQSREVGMPGKQQCEVLIIGSGEAGKKLAWTMAKTGRRTVVVERKLIGGSCPNIACLPSKNVIHSAKVAELARRGAEFGVMTERLTIDMARVYARKRRMVESEVRLHVDAYEASGAELIMGEAHFVAPKTVEVRSNDAPVRVLAGDQVFLDVGTHAAIPDVPGLKAAKPMTHVEALELDRLPKHLVVFGGGFVGLEFAQAMRRFGSLVTVLERGPQLAAREDSDVAEAILQLFQDEGIEVLLNTELLKVEGLSGQGIRIRLRNSQGERTLEGSHLLVATGRIPNTQGLGLEKTGVETDDRGYIRVNERLQTSAAGIWAMGECAGSPHFTHVATDDFRVVHDNLNGGNRTTSGRLVPFCMFTDPELARVGLNESEARRRAVPYRLTRIPMSKVRRTQTLSETRGFLKALISAESDEILGFTAFGTEAGEVLAVVQTAMLAPLPYTSLRDAILAHPTMAEGLNVLFAAVPARSRAQTAASRKGEQKGEAAA